MKKNYLRIIIIILFVGFIANLWLSSYIQEQKSLNEKKLHENVDDCFLDLNAGGCATVQTSIYATTFGVSNPLYGLVFFSLLAIAMIHFYVSTHSAFHKKCKKVTYWFDKAALLVLVCGTLFSAWLLFVQFFILKATCIYCLWVDGIMIASLFVYLYIRRFL